jgi:hypothetical protein
MAERVYGDAAVSREDRNAATLARWITREHPSGVHVRHVQREVRLPGLRAAADIHAAANILVEVDWLSLPEQKAGFVAGRAREAYAVNPRLREARP